MSREIRAKFIQRHDSSENWKANEDVVLHKGEIGIEFIENKAKMKVGDGLSSWKDLAYVTSDAEGIVLPDDYTWGNLSGIEINGSASETTNLKLIKPIWFVSV